MPCDAIVVAVATVPEGTMNTHNRTYAKLACGLVLKASAAFIIAWGILRSGRR